MSQICVQQQYVLGLPIEDQTAIRTISTEIYLGQPAIYLDNALIPWCVWDDDRIDATFWLEIAAVNGLAGVTVAYCGLPETWQAI